MRLAIVESPFAGKDASKEIRALETARNCAYARACLRDSILKGEAPLASHLLYTQPGILNDDDPEERALGIRCGFDWAEAAGTNGVRAVYLDLGESGGMKEGIKHAKSIGQSVDYRVLGPTWSESIEALGHEWKIANARVRLAEEAGGVDAGADATRMHALCSLAASAYNRLQRKLKGRPITVGK